MGNTHPGQSVNVLLSSRRRGDWVARYATPKNLFSYGSYPGRLRQTKNRCDMYGNTPCLLMILRDMVVCHVCGFLEIVGGATCLCLYSPMPHAAQVKLDEFQADHGTAAPSRTSSSSRMQECDADILGSECAPRNGVAALQRRCTLLFERVGSAGALFCSSGLHGCSASELACTYLTIGAAFYMIFEMESQHQRWLHGSGAASGLLAMLSTRRPRPERHEPQCSTGCYTQPLYS